MLNAEEGHGHVICNKEWYAQISYDLKEQRDFFTGRSHFRIYFEIERGYLLSCLQVGCKDIVLLAASGHRLQLKVSPQVSASGIYTAEVFDVDSSTPP